MVLSFKIFFFLFLIFFLDFKFLNSWRTRPRCIKKGIIILRRPSMEQAPPSSIRLLIVLDLQLRPWSIILVSPWTGLLRSRRSSRKVWQSKSSVGFNCDFWILLEFNVVVELSFFFFLFLLLNDILAACELSWILEFTGFWSKCNFVR